MKRTALIATLLIAPAAAHAATITRIPTAPKAVLEAAQDGQTQICDSQGSCITADAPDANCLPLAATGIEAWVCQGAVKITAAGSVLHCAVDTFTTPTGNRYRVRSACYR